MKETDCGRGRRLVYISFNDREGVAHCCIKKTVCKGGEEGSA
jgi:hypothetical protein